MLYSLGMGTETSFADESRSWYRLITLRDDGKRRGPNKHAIEKIENGEIISDGLAEYLRESFEGVQVQFENSDRRFKVPGFSIEARVPDGLSIKYMDRKRRVFFLGFNPHDGYGTERAGINQYLYRLFIPEESPYNTKNLKWISENLEEIELYLRNLLLPCRLPQGQHMHYVNCL